MLSRLASKVTRAPIGARSFSRSSAWGKNIQEAWLSDASTYPIIGIISIAGVMSIAWMGYTLMYNPDVRVRPSKRYNPRRNYLPFI